MKNGLINTGILLVTAMLSACGDEPKQAEQAQSDFLNCIDSELTSKSVDMKRGLVEESVYYGVGQDSLAEEFSNVVLIAVYAPEKSIGMSFIIAIYGSGEHPSINLMPSDSAEGTLPLTVEARSENIMSGNSSYPFSSLNDDDRALADAATGCQDHLKNVSLNLN